MKLIVWIFLVLPSTVMSFHEANFKLVTDPAFALVPLDAGWTDMSITGCASNCLKNYEKCGSFIYDETTGLCIPGFWPKYDPSTPSVLALYSTRTCDFEVGFYMVSSENSSACIRLSEEKVNYTDAAQSCREMDSHLVTTKNEAKLNLMQKTLNALPVDNNNWWFGLADFDMSGVFHWDDDGSPLDPDLVKVIFVKGEPEDYNISQVGAVFSKGYNPPLYDRE